MLFAGIDWSEKFLDFHLRTAEGKVLAEGKVKPSTEGMTVVKKRDFYLVKPTTDE